MKSFAKFGVIALVALIIVIAIPSCNYNRLVGLQQGVDQQWAQVQNVYQRRAVLIPNLVSTVSGAANFEKGTLTEITQARASVGQVKIDPNAAPRDPAQLAEFERSQQALGSALSRLLVVSENYPQLRANEGFVNLQAQLEGSENRISVERGKFNEVVQRYNTAVKSFPTVLYAGIMGFGPRPYFSGTPQAQTPPSVQFDFNSKAPSAAPAPSAPSAPSAAPATPATTAPGK